MLVSNRREILRTAGAAGVIGLAGCITSDTGGGGGDDGSSGDNGSSGGDGGTTLTWDAGGTGGTYYPLSNQFKQLVDPNTDYSLQVRSTGATVENIGNLASGSADFAIAQIDILDFAFNGTEIEEYRGNPVEELRCIAALYPESFHVVTPANRDISSLQELQGATINTGDLGSAIRVNTQNILDIVGVSEYNEQNSGLSQAADQLQNGDIDAAFMVGGWPIGALEDVATNSNIAIVPINGEERQQIKEANSYFVDDEIPAGTYQGIDQAVPTIAAQATIATTEQQPQEVVQSITAAIFDNVDEISIKEDFITVDSAQDGISIPLHPGAEAYFGTGDGEGGSSNNTSL